jgi:HlyD family secretion protein
MKKKIIDFKSFLFAHKIWSTVAIIAVLFIGYRVFASVTSTAGETRYFTGQAEKTTIISSVTGSGQVSSSDQINIKAKASGDITWIGVKAGDSVRAGQSIAAIDSVSAKQSIADAEASLRSAKLQFEQSRVEAPINYEKALDQLVTDENNLTTAYNDAFNNLSTTYLDMPGVMTSAYNTLYAYDLSTSHYQSNVNVLLDLFNNDNLLTVTPFADKAKADYSAAKSAYDPSLLSYKNLSRSAATSTIEDQLNSSVQTVTSIAQALQSELNFLSVVSDTANSNNIKIPSAVGTMQTSLRSALSTANGDLSSLLSMQKTLQNDERTITSDKQAIVLLQVGNPNGDNPISLQISEANIAKDEQDLANQKVNLSDYTVFAPFSGIIADVPVNVGDSSSGTIATIISDKRIAEISFNEVDAAKVKVGQKANMTFDAIDGLNISGVVSEIDVVGSVSQGVVTYNVKISMDTSDPRVKPGMTVNAAIITNVAQNVLAVPSSAVKTSNGQSYVQVFDNLPESSTTSGSSGFISTTLPRQVPVITGLSDDSKTEIVSGLSEGQNVVIRTVAGSTSSNSVSSAPSILGSTGAARSGNAIFRSTGR